METFDQICHRIRRIFERAGIETPALDARILARAGAGLDDLAAITAGNSPLSKQHIDEIEEFVERRLAGEPVSRILGEREFWGLPFMLSSDTLDPRSETELLVERAVSYLSQASAPRILDLGTGSGCILLSILHAVPTATGLGVDINPRALQVARENAARLGLVARAGFVASNWLNSIKKTAQFDLILSNPPYIPLSDIESLTKEVRFYDPILALDGGLDGLEAYRAIFTEIKECLKPNGRALFECGFGQAEQVKRLAENTGATQVNIHPDLAGIPRVVEICYGDNEKNV